ncbi:CDP-alcohol phosphatidyltransferase family protein [Mycetocola reblochoni]|uniref:CDP-alcohol phosphatidyltransferase n=2 Tax=Mycetocola reblochoni TaxID=331618 RepID=A0A1R4IG40_9MICO|nr:CDP-alcohol phosphatidyltransferase family protein [Mycetocola reblochoni]RLP69014.1 CDP-alcohol phosphatidyltransferase [Mycetocola reblochoni]SJN18790.1 hypothetical protein FM119_01625 [Mycetocola reblochoni REB411]
MTGTDPSTRRSIAASYRALGSARKGVAAGAPAYSVFVNRPLGRVFAAILHRFGWAPNAVTALSALFTAAGIGLIAAGPLQPWVGPVVWVLLAIGYALDSADGQVARLRGGGSLSGEWLDHVIDATKIPAIHLAVLVYLWRGPVDDAAVLLVPLVYSVVASTTFFAMILNDQLKRSAGVAEAVSASGASTLRSLVLLPTDYGVFCAVFIVLGAPVLFLPVYILFFVVNALFLVLALVRWFRMMGAVDAKRSESNHA